MTSAAGDAMVSAMAGTVHSSAALSNESEDARFARVLDAWGPALARLAMVYAADAEDRDDLMQEILFAGWRALRTFRGECAERTFLFRVAHNRALTHVRRRRRSVSLDEATAVADPRPDPAAEMVGRERHSQLMQAVRSLPDIQREVVVLHLEGLAHDEIAEVLGVTRNNVAVRLTRARDALHVLLGEDA